MAQDFNNSNEQLEKSRLQSAVLDYQKSKKLLKCAIAAIAVILVLLLVFLSSGWNNYIAGLAAVDANASVTDGADGKDGVDGEDGKDGVDGEDGKDGINGLPGADGADGQDGADGEDGEDGKDGSDGKDGQAGADGEDGKDGASGEDGKDGADGEDGKDGNTPYIGENGNWFINGVDTGKPATGGSSGGDGTGNTPPGDGSFTVQLDSKNGNKSIAVSETKGFANPTDHLNTNGLNNAWNITLEDIPVQTIDSDMGGANNGHDYFAYTFFLKNTGTETLDYNELLTLTENKLNAVKAVRFMLYRNGTKTIYASPAANGTKEPFACDESFTGDVNLISKNQTGLQPGQVVRYTVVVWFEGNDPECVNDILGGSVKLTLGFKIL